MTTVSSGADRRQVPLVSLWPFLLIAFGLAWGILGLFIAIPDRMTALFGKLTGQHPLFFLAVYSPAIAAFIVVIHKTGLQGFRRYLSRLLLWRCSPAWYAFLFIGIPLVFVGGSALKGNLLTEPFPFSSVQSLLVASVLAAIKGPIEEFGWRGLALPLFQRRFAPIWAALILGAIWGLWHLPAFLLSGTQQSEWSFSAFLAGCVAISIIAAALFNASRGSILLSAVFHYLLMHPIFPDAQPYDTYLLIGVAVAVIWLNRRSMFTTQGAFTEVVPELKPGDTARE